MIAIFSTNKNQSYQSLFKSHIFGCFYTFIIPNIYALQRFVDVPGTVSRDELLGLLSKSISSVSECDQRFNVKIFHTIPRYSRLW